MLASDFVITLCQCLIGKVSLLDDLTAVKHVFPLSLITTDMNYIKEHSNHIDGRRKY